jgi:aminoglycoside phosphotransferase (APT) family kinase protein
VPNPFELGALTEWATSHLGANGPLTVFRMGTETGIGNALYEIRSGGSSWVMRTPPPVLNHPSASNMLREWRILTALRGTPVPHPTPRGICEETDVIGVPFLVMDKVDGFTPGFALQEPFRGDAGLRRELAESYVDALVDLAEVDWRAGGLEGLGKPEGFLERQVPRWLGQLDGYRSRALPGLDTLTGWLERNRPADGPIGLLHGDYSPFNLMVAPDPPARLAAVIDWDTGTIGDPMLDIGHLVARWADPGEEPVIDAGSGHVDYGVRRTDLVARYGRRSGRDVSAMPYYAALALFKLAVILEGGYARQSAAGVPEEKNSMAFIVPRLIQVANEFATGRRAL